MRNLQSLDTKPLTTNSTRNYTSQFTTYNLRTRQQTPTYSATSIIDTAIKINTPQESTIYYTASTSSRERMSLTSVSGLQLTHCD